MSENTHLDKMLDKLIVDPWPTVAKPPTMTIEEAVGVLRLENERIFNFNNPQRRAALNLGIEALKRLQDNRRDPEFDHWIPLPGETEEAP